mgnify:CR=1 FL=1|tara:strand:- start:105 stop:581 length:477 start_codon:yes stop_codon:yes gene_type:complete
MEVSLTQSSLALMKTRTRATTKLTLFHSILIRLATSSLGAGALLSVLDALSDTYMISVFWKEEATRSVAHGLLACLSTNLACQSLITYLQHKHEGVVGLARELVFVFSFIKPGVDAYRVANFKEQGEEPLSAMTVLTVSKGIELATEGERAKRASLWL